MTWGPYYLGDGIERAGVSSLPDPPPWRRYWNERIGETFQATEGLIRAVNASLHLRRPLLITGPPGSGKSSVIDSISAELGLGAPLRWHITSRSVLSEALYRYDVLGRIHAQQLGGDTFEADDISDFMQLGPLGTALLSGATPRALLVDELDKSDFDLPSDLLEVLERGEFEIPELTRHKQRTAHVRVWDSDQRHEIRDGRVRSSNFPVIVLTSNGERDFPPPFLRRCVRYTMPTPTAAFLASVVEAHLGPRASHEAGADNVIAQFADRLENGDSLAIDQLLSAIHIMQGPNGPGAEESERLRDVILKDLGRP